MPRQARLDAPGTLHHVMVRGIEGTDLFRDDADRELFLGRLGELVGETGTRVSAWALMDNHVHLLVFSGSSGLSRFMRRLLTGYAIRYNLKYRRKGHLFQNRYKSIVCEEEDYLLELVRYIHLNPLRAEMVKSLEELDGYPWSGHGVLMGRQKRAWQDQSVVLERFGTTGRRAMKAYRRFMEEGKDQGSREDLSGGGLVRSAGGWSQVQSLRRSAAAMEHDARILGGSDFVGEMLREADRRLKREFKPRGRKTDLDRVVRERCREGEVGESELRGGGQRRAVSRVRAEIATILCRELGVTMAEAGRQLGVSTAAVAKAIRRWERGGTGGR